jgi:hypothetical protein
VKGSGEWEGMGWEGKWEGEMLCGDVEVDVEVRRGNEMWK